MQLVRYNPHHNVMTRSNNTINSMFDGLFDDFFGPSFTTRDILNKNTNELRVDIYEQEKTLVIEAEMPGVSKEDLQLNVKGKLITLGGEKKRKEEVTTEQQLRMERSSGKFERTFRMPFEIDAEKVVANYENGILRLEISKPEEKLPKQIEIN